MPAAVIVDHPRIMRRLFAAAMFLMIASCKTTPVAGECADNNKVPCMTRRICDEDKTRGCMVCTCEDPLVMPPAGEPPHRDEE